MNAKKSLGITAIAVLLVLVGLPTLLLLITAFTDSPPRPGAPIGNFTLENVAALASGNTIGAAGNSLVVSVFGTALAVATGTLMAWLTVRTDMPFRGLAGLAGIVPLFMSPLVGSLAWALLGSPNSGYLNFALTSIGLPALVNVYSLGGMVFVLGLFYAPYSFLMVASSLQLMNPELEEAASVHGASKRWVMRWVSLPLVTPAIAGSSLLTFVLISENFPVVQIFGAAGRVDTIPAQLFRLMTSTPQQPNRAAAIGVVLLLLLSAFLLIQRRYVNRRNYTTVTGKGFRPKRIPLGALRWPMLLIVIGYLCAAVLLPYAALLQSSLRSNQYVETLADLFTLEGLSFDSFIDAFEYEPFIEAMGNTLLVAAGTAVCGVMLNFFLAYLVKRSPWRGNVVLELLVNVPLAMPALVLSMAFLWVALRVPVPVYGTLLVLVLAYITRFLPQGFQGIVANIGQVHPDLEDAAKVSGARPIGAVARILLPLIKGGMASTALLLFILSFRELSAALFLFTSDTRVLSIVIYDQWEAGSWPRLAAMSLIYSAILLLVTLFARKWIGLESEKTQPEPMKHKEEVRK